jgi:hypothetical protein
MFTAEARLMRLEETSAIIHYFMTATPEYLELMGVDPSRLPQLDAWRARYAREFELPPEKRGSLLVSWLLDNQIVGFSTADKIEFGEHAHMHLHAYDRSGHHQFPSARDALGIGTTITVSQSCGCRAPRPPAGVQAAESQ